MKRTLFIIPIAVIALCFGNCSGDTQKDPDPKTSAQENGSIIDRIDTFKIADGKGMEWDVAYKHRKDDGSPLPPDLKAVFVSDIWTTLTMGSQLTAEDVDTAKVTKEIILQGLNYYKKNEFEQMYGFRPWTHWNFIRALNDQELKQLSGELMAFVKKYGVWEEKK
jgi:hypothetical protein